MAGTEAAGLGLTCIWNRLENPRRLMWANDFPHSDSTWPWSQELLATQTVQLSPEQTKAILSDNAASLYHVDIDQLVVAGA